MGSIPEKYKTEATGIPSKVLRDQLYLSILMFWNNRAHAPKVLFIKFGQTTLFRIISLTFSNVVLVVLKRNIAGGDI